MLPAPSGRGVPDEGGAISGAGRSISSAKGRTPSGLAPNPLAPGQLIFRQSSRRVMDISVMRPPVSRRQSTRLASSTDAPDA